MVIQTNNYVYGNISKQYYVSERVIQDEFNILHDFKHEIDNFIKLFNQCLNNMSAIYLIIHI